jgi:hypothetical protein
MQLQSNPTTIATYLEHYGYAVIRAEGEHKLVQLKNLKLVQIESRDDGGYIIQEVTLGQAWERWEDISIETVIEHIQMLEGGQDVYSKIWHIDDVLSIDPNLSRNHARLVLRMAMDNHDASIGINWDVLKSYIQQVVEMVDAGIL